MKYAYDFIVKIKKENLLFSVKFEELNRPTIKSEVLDDVQLVTVKNET